MLTPEENLIFKDVSFNEPSLLLDKFKDLDRISGSPDEEEAAQFIAGRLKNFGISYEILRPEIYLSIPLMAELKIIGQNIDINVKTPAYSMSTGDKWVDGELFFASSYKQPFAWDGFDYKLEFNGDPKGKIVICEGVPSPDKVDDIINNGGIAAVFVQYGERIHECTCTSVWGNPDMDDLSHMVKIPVVSVNNKDGRMLISMLNYGKVRVAIKTLLEEGWKVCPLVLAKIEGYMEPEKFVLLHGHMDSWHKGIGDNALGNATLLETARIINKYKDNLKRSVWIAWWPGHSTGRYGGSAWFADHYAMELYDNCIAQINCESTGCKNADTYDGIVWTEDVDSFCRELVSDVTGIEPVWARPGRAGDYSFNNIGITSLFMLSSTIGKKKLEELNYYEVYGCGGNIEWHTEDDDMRIVDERIFIRDTRMYLAALWRMANADIFPIDSREMLHSMARYLDEYRKISKDEIDLKPIYNEIDTLLAMLDNFYEKARNLGDDHRLQADICDKILKIQRKLIRISYTGRKEFKHDPAAMVPPLPDVAPILKINNIDENTRKFLLTQLIRGRNRVVHALKECEQLIKDI